MAYAPTEPASHLAPRDLPAGFRVGAATSSHQIEGAVHEGGRGESIWDRLATRPGAIADGSSGAIACDHLHRVEEDLDLLAELGADVYRFSIAWPRIQPEGRGRPLAAGLAFYDRLVDGLLARGIEPWPTLYHWDLPQVLEDAYGGWRGRDTAGRFADYAEAVGGALGDRVRRWATLNEPWCSAWLGYQNGVHAPGVRDEAGSVRAAHHLLVGHGLATQALRATGAAEVGVVVNLAPVRPATDAHGDVVAAERADGMQNRYWLGALAGAVPEDVTEAFAGLLELETLHLDGDAALIAQPLDWLGVNYYTPMVARAGDDPALRPAGPALDGVELLPPGPRDPGNMLGWHIDATGMGEVLEQAATALPGVPIAVTENGLPAPDEVGPDGRVHDPHRVAYLSDHLAATLAARDRGVPVDAYLAWSLLDNFEWAEGYGPRFGIVHVDFDTQVRTPKTSYDWLRSLLRDR